MSDATPEVYEHHWFMVSIKVTNPIGMTLKCLNCGAEYLMEPNDLEIYGEPLDEDIKEGKELRQ